jgi:thiamine-phosphate pyrophosphorylase
MTHNRQPNPRIITLPEIYPNEARALFALVENGAEILHIRKPEVPENALCEYLTDIHPEIRHHLTLHRNRHLAAVFGLGGVHEKPDPLEKIAFSGRKSASCHHWAEVKRCTGRADYVFLSPIFDSISKAGYRAAFAREQLRILLQDPDRPPVAALGGITPHTAALARTWGFEGAAALGSVWALRDGRIDIARPTANYTALVKAWNTAKESPNYACNSSPGSRLQRRSRPKSPPFWPAEGGGCSCG